MKPYFLGEFNHAVDGQRRVALPREWRVAGGDSPVFYLLPGRDHCIHLMSEAYFETAVVAKLARFSFANAGKSEAFARLGAEAARCGCDRQGRITLPQRMMEYAGIGEQAVLVGAVLTALLMAPDNWGRDPEAVADALDQLQAIQEDH